MAYIPVAAYIIPIDRFLLTPFAGKFSRLLDVLVVSAEFWRVLAIKYTSFFNYIERSHLLHLY